MRSCLRTELQTGAAATPSRARRRGQLSSPLVTARCCLQLDSRTARVDPTFHGWDDKDADADKFNKMILEWNVKASVMQRNHESWVDHKKSKGFVGHCYVIFRAHIWKRIAGELRKVILLHLGPITCRFHDVGS